MNLIDRAIEYMDPISAVRRAGARNVLKVVNTGYSEGGASTGKNWARDWRWRGGSVREDQEVNLATLRQRSRDLYMNSPIATAALNRRTVNVIGAGLRMRSVPDAEVLGITPDEATAWARIREREFALWARSRECEVSGLDNFEETQGLAYLSWILNGDAFGLLTMAEPADQPYELRVQLLESDRVCNPPGKDRDPLFHEGVETDADGRVVAYHIRTTHPLGQAFTAGAPKWSRIPVRGPESGRLNVVHLIARQRAGQYRGIPILAPVIESCKQLTRYSEAELTAAVIAAFLTVLVKSQTPQTPFGEAFAPGIVTPSAEAVGGQDVNPNAAFELPWGSASMVALNPDESAEVVNPARPNAQFGTFLDEVEKEIGAATDIPVELLTLKFTSTYTAARAALLEFWKRARMDRSAFAADCCDPIAQAILEEGLLKGRIRAEGYWDDPGTRAAWLACQWNGQSMGQMNPKDEVEAAQLRVDGGFSTHARESIEISGIDFDDVVQEQKVERARLEESGIPGPRTPGTPKPAQ
jgi:lambda family phage portal protein